MLKRRSAFPLLGSMILSLFILGLITTSGFAANYDKSSELNAYKALSNTKLKDTRELLQTEIDNLTTRINGQDTIINDRKTDIENVMSTVSDMLTILAILLPLAGTVGYFQVQGKARRAAEDEANKAASLWFATNANDLKEQISSLKNEFEASKRKAETEIDIQMQGLNRLIQVAEQSLQKNVNMRGASEADESNLGISQEDVAILDEAALSTKQKPEVNYTFKDWNIRAFAAFSNGDKEGAARYWQAAAGNPSVEALSAARSLFNAGVALWELNRFEESIRVYEQIVQQFEGDSDLNVLEQVAKASVNKTASYNKLGRHDDAIASCQYVLDRFSDTNVDFMRQQVTRALMAKGETLTQMGRYEEALGLFQNVIEQTSEATDESLAHMATNAYNTGGFSLLCLAKKMWLDGKEDAARNMLGQALAMVETAIRRKPDTSVYLGNQGYILFLVGDIEKARPILSRAITLGGDELRQLELKDADIYPLPQDEAFKELIKTI